MNAESNGFLNTGTLYFGKNLPISMLNINSTLIIIKVPKAIGDTMPIILVSDTCSTVVKINPNRNINIITPKVMISPNIINNFLSGSFCLDNFFERYDKNPG